MTAVDKRTLAPGTRSWTKCDAMSVSHAGVVVVAVVGSTVVLFEDGADLAKWSNG